MTVRARITEGDIVISPFMVYTADTSGEKLGEDTVASTELMENLPRDVLDAVTHKLALKGRLGTPADKTLDLADLRTITNLTADRQAALDVTQFAIERRSGESTHLYTLGQTALMLDKVEVLRRGELFGSPLVVRVEEGMSTTAHKIAIVNEGLGTDVESEESEIRRVHLSGTKRTVQTRGYELNPANASQEQFRQRIPHIPACEMYMAAAALDQAMYGDRTVRILPWFMEDREEGARYALQNYVRAEQPDDVLPPIESVILGPSGDIKRVFGWFGTSPDLSKELFADRRAHSAASRIVDTLHNQTALRFASHRNGGKPYHLLFTPDMDIATRVTVAAEQPNSVIPIIDKTLRPNADSDTIETLFQDMTHFDQIITPAREKPELSVEEIDGANTNHVAIIVATRAGGYEGRDVTVRTQFVFESVTNGFLSGLSRFSDADTLELYAHLQQATQDSQVTLRYASAEIDKR